MIFLYKRKNLKFIIIFVLVFIIGGILIWQSFKILKRAEISQKINEIFSGKISEEFDPLLGMIYDVEFRDSWEYYGGVMEQYRAYNEYGEIVNIVRNQETGRTLGFNVGVSIAEKVVLSEEEAQKIAKEIASKTPFYSDSSLNLTESGLKSNINVKDKPEVGSFYYFLWQAQDFNSGAELLRRIEVDVHAETGQVIRFSSHDLGTVYILTIPKITGEKAINIALAEGREYFSEPKENKKRLFVSLKNGEQRLLWELIIKESDPSIDISPAMWFYIDAHSGEIINIEK